MNIVGIHGGEVYNMDNVGRICQCKTYVFLEPEANLVDSIQLTLLLVVPDRVTAVTRRLDSVFLRLT